MALTNSERVNRALSLLREGLAPFVDREINSAIKRNRVPHNTLLRFGKDPHLGDQPFSEWDVAALLKIMSQTWREVFQDTLGYAERNYVHEMRDHRNKWAHQKGFSSDDVYRVLDTAGRLLNSISAPQATEVEQLKLELQRTRYEDQSRQERRRLKRQLTIGRATGSMKPWRQIAIPHDDVAGGHFRQAEFAADLWQVHQGEGSSEYVDPVEFFGRTYLTESLRDLLISGMERLSGQGGDPVVQLQTNFGGGKTHSMLALYHLFSGADPMELEGIGDLMREAKIRGVPAVKRVILVGNKISPGNPSIKPDGTEVRTLWGEMVWQLGGPSAFAKIKMDDENATNPGDILRQLLNELGPCLILIDEWVAYARQLHDQNDLPGGSFDTQFTFAQALTESVKAAQDCMLVVSLPASDLSVSPHVEVEHIEVGGQRGREALHRLRNVIGRVETSWKPASAQEGFEIVRRRLFRPFTDRDQFVARDITARQFAKLYRQQSGEFPADCSERAYEGRLRDAYPIHPEVFDRLYSDWSTIARFQRTRGVLRLMAAVIHCLWENGDQSPLILPSSLPIDDRHVSAELTRYLPDNWTPTIAKDVDGPHSLPVALDNDVPNLGKYSACRRVARAIYLGSAPTSRAQQRGIEDLRIKLGCTVPGEPQAIFGDAIRRLTSGATYLYQDGARYWYDVRPTVAKLARDIMEQLKREPERVNGELTRHLGRALRSASGFSRIHVAPKSGHDVPDELETRLVVLDVDHIYHKGPQSPAETKARDLLESRGASPRQFRNTLVFLAADQARLHDLQEAVRGVMAWKHISDHRDSLELTSNDVIQARERLSSAQESIEQRLLETFQWLLIPVQSDPGAPIQLSPARVRASGQLAERAFQFLSKEEYIVVRFAGTRLRMEVDRVPLWRGDQVEVRQLVEDFAKYPYLQRVQSPAVLLGAISDGVALPFWEQESFAYADSWSAENDSYIGLRAGVQVNLAGEHSSGLIVKSTAANIEPPTPPPPPPPTPPPPTLTSFFGSVAIDPELGKDAIAQVRDEVIQHLSSLKGVAVSVELDIRAEFAGEVPEATVRTIQENCRALKFQSYGFNPA
ncbi:MAG: Swt1 family HEPN domain-containing protein [Bacteroidota bacterium]|nr:Swt1 family HEPN domain-containing protein [Bacteroidota bacterium]